MKIKMFVIALLFLACPHLLWALTGRQIMEQSDKLASPDSAKADMRMTIYKGSREDKKEFTIFAKKYDNDEDKTLLSFHKPTRIKLLTHAHKDAEDDQWLVLSSGRVKRIAGADKGKSFVHSHFYYEDLGSRDIDDFDYQYLGDTNFLDTDCYLVQRVKKKAADRVYDKSVLYVRKSDYFVVRIDFYQKGKLHKTLENHDIRKVDGILTPFRAVMALPDGKGRTELDTEQVAYNIEIADLKFNKEALR